MSAFSPSERDSSLGAACVGTSGAGEIASIGIPISGDIGGGGRGGAIASGGGIAAKGGGAATGGGIGAGAGGGFITGGTAAGGGVA